MFRLKKRIATTLVACLLAFSVFPGVSIADNLQQTNPKVSTNNNVTALNTDSDYNDFLVKKGVSKEDLAKLDVNSLKSLVNQANAYNFTDQQVQQYVEGLIKEQDPSFPALKSVQGTMSEDGSYFTTPSGNMPNTLKRFTKNNPKDLQQQSSSQSTSNSMTPSFSGGYNSIVNSSDQTGVYWAVESGTGYNEATAFVTLPSISNISSNDRPYVMFSANTYPSSIAGDYGVVYYPSYGWTPIRSAAYWNGSGYSYLPPEEGPHFSGINLIYLDVTANASANSVRIRVLNGSNFSDVLWDYTTSFNGYYNNAISSSYSNLNLYREVTLAQFNNGTLNTNTGTNMNNASPYNSYIYSPSGYWQWGTSQTSNAYRQAPSSTQLNTVHVNSYSQWYTENISIDFNVQ